MSGIKVANGVAASAEMLVDTNGSAQMTGPTNEALSGFQALAVQNDAGTVTTTRWVSTAEVTNDFRLRVGVDQVIMSEWFPGTALNSSIWATPVSVMTVTVAAGYVTLNAGASVANAAVARLVSWRYFPITSAGLSFRCRLQIPFAPVALNVTEWGMFIASSTTAPTDGVFFRMNSASQLICVLCANSVETSSVALSAALIPVNSTRNFAIDIYPGEAVFWIDDVCVARISTTGVGAFVSAALPVAARTYNVAGTASAQAPKIASVAVLMPDTAAGMSCELLAAAGGSSSTQGATGSGTIGQTIGWVNAASPAAIVPTNTTAAFAAGLGGLYLETATLAAGNDGIIASYQVPAGTVAIPGRCLVITGVNVQSAIHTAIVGGACARGWALAYGHTLVSLLTAESLAAGTKAPRRMALGVQAVSAAAAAGVQETPVGGEFSTPIVVNPGEFVQVVVKSVGTAITAGAFLHSIQISGYWL